MSLAQHRAAGQAFARETLLQLPDGTKLSMAEAYIPLLIAFTHEDKAAKGLRKGRTAQYQTDAVYFTVLEAVRDNRVLLLTGPSGSGKTTFAKYLCHRSVAGTKQRKDQSETSPVYRNEQGLVLYERWEELVAGKVVGYYFDLSQLISQDEAASSVNGIFCGLMQEAKGSSLELVIVLDNAQVLGGDNLRLLTSLIGTIEQSETDTRLVLLADAQTCGSWKTPASVTRLSLLPLLAVQRAHAVSRWLRSQDEGATGPTATAGTGNAASNPALFALALQSRNIGDNTENIVDTWISTHVDSQEAVQALERQSPENILSSSVVGSPPTTMPEHPALSTCVVRSIIASRHVSQLPAAAILQLYETASSNVDTLIRSVLARLIQAQRQDVISAFLASTSQHAPRGALLVADFVEDNDDTAVDKPKVHMLDIISQGHLTVEERVRAGRISSRLGDTRDLQALADVPAGDFTFGADAHENSRPVSQMRLPGFKIGRFPVVNRDYLRFVSEAGRDWHSPDKNDRERRNFPATDLTWHDARAYCAWLTLMWRKQGTITANEEVRLPTEPEWERAARGDHVANQAPARENGVVDVDEEPQVYPWSDDWDADASNNDETGLNSICPVGLFPKGKSPYGCHDMTGQAWEWCSTLWGTDMATPQYKYPYTLEDGREDVDAPDAVRRVLRGGCFSSGRTKATCTYRGSLEASGFWRGNGFRVVVALLKTNH